MPSSGFAGNHADFTLTIDTANPRNVTFQDLITGAFPQHNPWQIDWGQSAGPQSVVSGTFPAGTTGIGSPQTHPYPTSLCPVTYYVTFTVANAGPPKSKPITIPATTPTLDFQPQDQTQVPASQPVTFVAPPGYSSYTWTFGDNIGAPGCSPTSAMGPTTQFTFNSTNTHTVTLTVTLTCNGTVVPQPPVSHSIKVIPPSSGIALWMNQDCFTAGRNIQDVTIGYVGETSGQQIGIFNEGEFYCPNPTDCHPVHNPHNAKPCPTTASGSVTFTWREIQALPAGTYWAELYTVQARGGISGNPATFTIH